MLPPPPRPPFRILQPAFGWPRRRPRRDRLIGPFDPATLITPLGGGYLPLTPATQADPVPAPALSNDSILQIGKTLAASGTQQPQQAILAALRGYDAAPPGVAAPLTRLAEQAGICFQQSPMIVSYVGETGA